MKIREKIPRTRNPARSTRLKHCSRCPRQAGIEQSEGPARVFVEELPLPSIKQLGGITPEPPALITQILVITRL
jgi:hypothetical protein